MKFAVVVSQRLPGSDVPNLYVYGVWDDETVADRAVEQLNDLSGEELFDYEYILTALVFDEGVVGPLVKALMASGEVK